MNCNPTNVQNLFFLNILFGIFPWIKPFYRRIEKKTISIQVKKERIKFLKNCLDEKVIPVSLSWIKKLDKTSPFPEETKKVLLEEIDDLKEDIEESYCYLRREKKYLFSQMHDVGMKNRLNTF